MDCAWTAGSLSHLVHTLEHASNQRGELLQGRPTQFQWIRTAIFPIEMAIWRYLLVSDNTYIILYTVLTSISPIFPIFLRVFWWYQTWIFGSAIFQGSSLDIPWTKSSSACRSTSTSEANSKKEWRHWNQMSNGFWKTQESMDIYIYIWIYIYIYGINVYIIIYIYGIMIFSRFPTFLSWGLL